MASDISPVPGGPPASGDSVPPPAVPVRAHVRSLPSPPGASNQAQVVAVRASAEQAYTNLQALSKGLAALGAPASIVQATDEMTNAVGQIADQLSGRATAPPAAGKATAPPPQPKKATAPPAAGKATAPPPAGKAAAPPPPPKRETFASATNSMQNDINKARRGGK